MRLRALLVAAAITAIAASPIHLNQQAEAAGGVTGITMTAPPQLLDTPDRHSAFPGAALRPDGTLVLVWRGDVDHATTRHGVILRAESHDLGKTWSTPTVVLTRQSFPILANQDLRDPYVAYVDGHEYLTFFTGVSDAFPATGAWVVRDLASGGEPVRIDGGMPYAAISGPVVRLPDGRLGTAFYGRLPGELVDTAWMAWSTDGGASWSKNRVLNAIGANIPTPEPWLVVDGGTVHFFARWGGSQIAQRSSTNSGTTFDTARIAITGCNGRPSTLATKAGTIVMVCRDTRGGTWGDAKVAYSVDHTASWFWGPTVMASQGSLGMVYGAPVEVLRGVLVLPFGMERADGSAGLYVANLAENWVAGLTTKRAAR